MWDRFDDAMDDIADEESIVRDQVEELERQLRELGEEIPSDHSREPTARYASDSAADVAHREAFDDLAALRTRRDRLVELVGAARNRRYENGPT